MASELMHELTGRATSFGRMIERLTSKNKEQTASPVVAAAPAGPTEGTDTTDRVVLRPIGKVWRDVVEAEEEDDEEEGNTAFPLRSYERAQLQMALQTKLFEDVKATYLSTQAGRVRAKMFVRQLEQHRF